MFLEGKDEVRTRTTVAAWVDVVANDLAGVQHHGWVVVSSSSEKTLSVSQSAHRAADVRPT
jgi:hypothetical protein